MKYILLDRQTLTVKVKKKPSKKSFIIPTELDDFHLSPIEEAIYYWVLYPAAHAEDRKKYPDDEKKGIHREYQLFEPQPWLIAIGYLMWQGIVQGFTWDVVKLFVRQAINELSSNKRNFSISLGTFEDSIR